MCVCISYVHTYICIHPVLHPFRGISSVDAMVTLLLEQAGFSYDDQAGIFKKIALAGNVPAFLVSEAQSRWF